MNSADDLLGASTTTKKIKKILVPVDYSECSKFACRYAIKIACKVGAELKLFHTYYSPAFDLIELAGAVQTQTQLKEEVMVNLEQSEKETAEGLVKELQAHIDQCGMPEVYISYEIVPGVPEDEIIRFSEMYAPDLVVMGTHGKGTGMGSIMGSVTAGIYFGMDAVWGDDQVPLWPLMLLGIIVALGIQPLWKRVQELTNRIFYRGRYSTRLANSSDPPNFAISSKSFTQRPIVIRNW